MSWIRRSSGPFIIMMVLGFWVLVFSIYDIIYGKEWIVRTFAAYALVFVMIFVLFYMRMRSRDEPLPTVEEFEKRLKGGLYHFKCPTCDGIFAIKKSKGNNKKYFKMNCPDCGAMGMIPPNPSQVEEVIPEKKSVKANFKCKICGEGVTVWAEGTDLNENVNVFWCPFCGEKEPLRRF